MTGRTGKFHLGKLQLGKFLGLDSLLLWLLKTILNRWVKTSLVASVEDVSVDPDAVPIYVIKNRSAADGIIVERECEHLKLSFPFNAINQDGLQLRRSIFPLAPTASFGRTPPAVAPQLQHIVEAMQENPELKVELIPVSVFWGRRPEREQSFFKALLSDSWRVPSLFRKFLIVITHARNTHIQFSKPLSIREFLNEGLDSTRTARKVSRVLRIRFRRQRQAFVGPDLSHRRTLVNTLLHEPTIREAIKVEAQQRHAPERKVAHEARKYAYEIAADYSHPMIRAYDIVLGWLWNKLYNGVVVHNIEELKRVAQDYELIYTPSHRSHIDYLLLSYVLYHNRLVPPHIAAGINLNLPVLGGILRRGGAFFLRRSFKGNKLYAAVFKEYLHQVFSKGFAVEYFIEGGRSRTGRLLQPKAGMLSMTVRSYLRNPAKPMAFIPIYVGYEKIIEGRTYIGELSGSKKKKESLLDIPRTLRRLKGTFGQVHVSFGKPVLMESFVTDYKSDWRTADKNEDGWVNDCVAQLGPALLTQINNAAVINPVNLMATALLSTPKHAMDQKALTKQIDYCLHIVKQQRYSERLEVTPLSAAEIIKYAQQLGIIHHQKHELGDVINLDETTAILMTYFRNNVMHVFALSSLIANFIIRSRALKEDELIAACELIYPYLRSELFMHWQVKDLKDVVPQAVNTLIELGLIERNTSSHQLHAPADNSAEYYHLNVLADTIKQTLERFYITVSLLLKQGSGTHTQRQLENLCHLVAQRMSMLLEFNAPEFFDKAMFSNFLSVLKRAGIIWTDADNHVVFDDRLREVDRDASLILGNELRQSVVQVTRLESEVRLEEAS